MSLRNGAGPAPAATGGEARKNVGSGNARSSKPHPQNPQAAPSPSWRDVLSVHPAANNIPEASDDERRGLVADLAKRGPKVPVVLVRVAGASPQLVDGRHRLDLLEGTGIKVVGDDGGVLVQHQIVDVADDTEAERLSLSLNAHRRHLQADERRKLLRAQLIVTPEKSNRQVAKLTGFSHPHVAKVRTELEQAGDVETVSTSIDTKGRRQSIRKGTTSKASTKTRRRTKDDLKSDIAAKIAAVAPATPDEVVREVVAPDEEIELLREFATFVLFVARSVSC